MEVVKKGDFVTTAYRPLIGSDILPIKLWYGSRIQ